MKLLVIILAATGAAFVPEAFFDEDGVRVLVIFLGLLASSILPTISLTIGNMVSQGRTPFGITELHHELESAVRRLISTFGSIALAVGYSIVFLMRDRLIMVEGELYGICYEVILSSVAQALLAALLVIVFFQIAHVPTILLRSLSIKREIAIEEARLRLDETAPKLVDIKASFPTSSEFGKRVKTPLSTE